jgi:hypothetical protein
MWADNVPRSILGYFKYVKYTRIFHNILSFPQNIVMDMNNVMYGSYNKNE